jgi:uncharacterized protein (TIGR02466 family)
MSKQEDFTVKKYGDETAYEIHSIFPIPVYTKENLINDIDIPALSNIDSLPKELYAANWDYGERSENPYILDLPSFLKLKNVINTSLQEYANQVMGFAGEYVITQSWLSIKKPMQRHIMHSHANSIISGVFYFGNDEDASGLSFSKNAVSNTWQMAPLMNPNVQNNFTFTEITLKVENHMLCMFPSWLAHRVEANQSKKNRYSIAFNAVPKYSLGSETDLTELEYFRLDRKE